MFTAPELKKAFQNTKVVDFAFGKTHICPTCHRTITNLSDIKFLELNHECLRCDTIRGDVATDYAEEFFSCDDGDGYQNE